MASSTRACVLASATAAAIQAFSSLQPSALVQSAPQGSYGSWLCVQCMLAGPLFFGFSDVHVQRALAAMYTPAELAYTLYGRPLSEGPLTEEELQQLQQGQEQQQQQQEETVLQDDIGGAAKVGMWESWVHTIAVNRNCMTRPQAAQDPCMANSQMIQYSGCCCRNITPQQCRVCLLAVTCRWTKRAPAMQMAAAVALWSRQRGQHLN